MAAATVPIRLTRPERLVANLVDNAVGYNVPGGEVRVTTGVRDGRPVLCVANSGVPIPAEQVGTLLEPFQRLDRTASRQGHHGLGLSIVRAIAAAHDASIDAAARPGGGLRIEVAFGDPDGTRPRTGTGGRRHRLSGEWHADLMTTPEEELHDSLRLHPAPRWVAPVFTVLGLATIPWTAYLAMSLPQQARTHNYRLAWVGFDLMLVVVLLATGHLAWRGSRLAGLLAASTAAMLVVDAWFDVTTSRRSDVPEALLTAVLIELPLAGVCCWIALHVDEVVERRMRQLARRAADPRPRRRPATPPRH